MFTQNAIHFVVSNLSHQVKLTEENISLTSGKEVDSLDWSSFKNYCKVVFGPSQQNQFDLVEEMFFSEVDLQDKSFVKKAVSKYISQVFEEYTLMEQLKRVPMPN